MSKAPKIKNVPVPDCPSCPNVLICPGEYAGLAWCATCRSTLWLTGLYGNVCSFMEGWESRRARRRKKHPYIVRIVRPIPEPCLGLTYCYKYVSALYGVACRGGIVPIRRQVFPSRGALTLAGCCVCQNTDMDVTDVVGDRRLISLFSEAWSLGMGGSDTWSV